MKRIKYKLLITAIIILNFTFCLCAQNEFSHSVDERVSFFTDRSLYITGENILFTINLLNSSQFNSSDIVYIELITPNGESILNKKYKLLNCNYSGEIALPNDLLTGYYYIKAYTKIMRNIGSSIYSLTAIKIINPHKDEVLNYTVSEIFNNSKQEIANPSFQISTNKSVYSNREQVITAISCNSKNDEFKNITVSVIPEFSYFNWNWTSSNANELLSDGQFNVENNGISITGKIIDEKTGLYLANTAINLSIIGKDKDFMATISDSLGFFYFILPDLLGQNSIFLSCLKNPETHPKVLIFNDFCTNKLDIKTPTFKLSKEEREIAYKIAVNKEISSIFRQDSMQVNKLPKTYDELFYGKPARILYPDKYIDMPTLEDCFYELAFNVKVTKVKNEKYFKVIGTRSELSVYDPLVLVDMVAVTDYKKVLAISPKTISHVDIINTPYVKGHMTYGGIISIFTKDADYGGINLPETGIFLNYQFLSNKSIDNNKTDKLVNKPDTRNNLFWEPDLSLNSNKSAIVNFYTSDTNGKYIILIRANKENGEYVSQMHYFEVK